MKLASFDIFDTVLIRKCGKPENIFYLLAHRLYPDNDDKKEKFIAWRKQAERRVVTRINGREITITDIYSDTGVDQFDDYSPARLIEVEKKVEAENLTANPDVKSIIKKHRADGITICFISDMYLDSNFLADVLRREECLEGDEKVFVSCEAGARKSNGKLYDKVREILKPCQWTHYGDHPVSDIKRATEHGIMAHRVETSYSECEKSISSISKPSISCLAGLQRCARITNGNNVYNKLAADYVAPAYIPYTNFVMRKAQEKKIKRLYFLSRDSYLLQEIAETQKNKYPNIETKNLFVSRKALLLPYLRNATAEKFLAVQDKKSIIGKNVEELLVSIGTSVEELKNRYAITFDFTRIASREEENIFLTRIFGDNSNYKQRLEELATEKLKLLNAYLEQEGVFNDGKTAMVDVGWLGTTRLMINSILEENGCCKTLFFYYGIRRDVIDEKYGKFITYLTPQELSTELTAVIEDYFSASPYPSTIGYKHQADKIVPLFKEGEKFSHNNITVANTQIAVYIAEKINEMGFFGEKLLKDWCLLSINDLLTLKHKDLDLSPLCEAGIFEGKQLARKLTRKEVLGIIILGNRYTAFDKASIRLTTGYKMFPFIWNIASITANIKRFIYLRLIHKQ